MIRHNDYYDDILKVLKGFTKYECFTFPKIDNRHSEVYTYIYYVC